MPPSNNNPIPQKDVPKCVISCCTIIVIWIAGLFFEMDNIGDQFGKSALDLVAGGLFYYVLIKLILGKLLSFNKANSFQKFEPFPDKGHVAIKYANLTARNLVLGITMLAIVYNFDQVGTLYTVLVLLYIFGLIGYLIYQVRIELRNLLFFTDWLGVQVEDSKDWPMIGSDMEALASKTGAQFSSLPTTARYALYHEEMGKDAIWRGRVTNIYKEWEDEKLELEAVLNKVDQSEPPIDEQEVANLADGDAPSAPTHPIWGLNDIAWDHLMNKEFFQAFHLGLFIKTYGEKQKNFEAKAYGIDIVASTLTMSPFYKDHKLAFNLFKQVQQISPEYVTNPYFRQAIRLSR